MNKKLLSVILVLMLLVCLTTCLISCAANDTNDTNTTEEQKSSSFKVHKVTNIDQSDRIIVVASESMDRSEVIAGLSLNQAGKGNVQIDAIPIGGNQFKIITYPNFVLGAKYTLRLTDTRLSVVDPKDATKVLDSKIVALVVTSDEISTRDLGTDVIELDEAYLSNFTSNGNLNTFQYDADVVSTLIDKELAMGDIIYTGKKAYQVAGVANTNTPGTNKVSYVLPDYEKVYNTLKATSKANLEEGSVKFDTAEEAADKIVSLVSCAGFDVGPVRVDANKLTDDTVRLSIAITVNDVLGEKDGINALDLILTFTIDSQVNVETDINIGAVIGKNSNIGIIADFKNTLTFNVELKDGVAVSEGSELDAIITKIRALVQNSNEDIVTIPVFNWVVPIGNGVADVSFQVNAALDLAFSGKLGVEASATSGFKAEIKYNPATDEKTANITETQGLSFDAATIYFDGNAAIYLGVNATIKFDLLGGVISVGIGAEVGNYNKIYGTIGTTNLTEDDISAVYGYYFEGGIYYDAKFLYSVAKITSGEKSFFNGRQEKKLYDAGDPIVITEATVNGLVYIDGTAKDLDITISTKNLITGEEITGVKLEDFAKIEDITDDNIIVENGTIKVVGELTAETTKIKVDSIEITVSVSAIKVIAADTDVGTLDAGEYRLPDGTIIIVE